MVIKIIDNKKIDMTEDEYTLYKDICRSYDRPNFKGEELFRELFETDHHGMIIFLRPPNNRHTSMEVFMFMMVIFQHQNLRFMHKKVDDLCADLSQKVAKLIENKSSV
jgi:hypothetical protein